MVIYIIIDLEAFLRNVFPADFAVFVLNGVFERVFESGRFGDGEDFVGKLVVVPEVVAEGATNDLGDAGLFGEDEDVAMVGGFEGGEAERFGDARHDEDVGELVNVAQLAPADEASEDDVFRDAEFGGEADEFGLFFAVAREDEYELGVFADGFGGGMEEVTEALLDGEAADGTDDGVTLGL